MTEKQQLLLTNSISDSANPGKDFPTFADAVADLKLAFDAKLAEGFQGSEWQLKVFRLTALGKPPATQTWAVHCKLPTVDDAGFDAAAVTIKTYYDAHSAANPPKPVSFYQVQVLAVVA